MPRSREMLYDYIAPSGIYHMFLHGVTVQLSCTSLSRSNLFYSSHTSLAVSIG